MKKFFQIPSPNLLQGNELEAISSNPITCHLRKETNPHFAAVSFRQMWRVIRSSLSILLGRLNNPSSLSCSSTSCFLVLHQLCCPSLHTLKQLISFFSEMSKCMISPYIRKKAFTVPPSTFITCRNKRHG